MEINQPTDNSTVMAPAEMVSAAAGSMESPGRIISPRRPLTIRETQVAVLVAMGMKEKDIGTALGITEATVNSQKYSVGRKMGGRFNRVVITHWCIQEGLVKVGELANHPGNQADDGVLEVREKSLEELKRAVLVKG